jgi:hydrogenase maturation protease
LTFSTDVIPDVVVIGIGNAFRGDDAAGLEAVRAVAGRAPEGVLVLECHGGGMELLEAWRGRNTVVLVDAMHAGAAPGAIVRFSLPGRTIPLRALGTSTHAFGIGDAIEYARMMGELPPTLVVFGIEGRSFSYGNRLTPEIAERIPVLVNLLHKEIENLRQLKAA